MLRKLSGVVVSAAILAFIYWQIDVTKLLEVLGGIKPGLFALALLVWVPVTLLPAWRLQLLAPRDARLGLWEATRLVLMASTLNMVLPSKMGDLAKAYALYERGRMTGSLAFTLVVFEKGLDVVALLLWCFVGLIFVSQTTPAAWSLAALIGAAFAAGALALAVPRLAERLLAPLLPALPDRLAGKARALSAAWSQTVVYVWGDWRRAVLVIAASVLTWFLHLAQIWLFVLALDRFAPFLANLALAPLAILVGLLPFTIAGIGTRDAALILLYRPYLDPPSAAALGVLCTLRYLLPAFAGLPLLGRYLQTVRVGVKLGPDSPG